MKRDRPTERQSNQRDKKRNQGCCFVACETSRSVLLVLNAAFFPAAGFGINFGRTRLYVTTYYFPRKASISIEHLRQTMNDVFGTVTKTLIVII